LLYEPENRFFARAELNGKSSQYESNTHNEKRSAFNVFNASAGFRQGNWTFTVWTKNLFDENYEERVFFFANEGNFSQRKRYEAPAAPRSFGITANYRW
jgi:outer membrane receptor protein involved in Fe transport